MTTRSHIALSIISICFPILLQSQNSHFSTLSVEQIHLLEAAVTNPGVVPFLKTSSIQIQFQNQYLLKELTYKGVNGCFKWKENYFPIGISHFGYSQFGILDFRLGYSRLWGGKIACNLNFIYLFNHIAENPNRNGITFEVSGWGKINSKWGMGFKIFNPAKLNYLESEESLIPIQFWVMGSYKINESLLLFGHFVKYAPGNSNFQLSFLMQKKETTIEAQFSLQSIGISYIFSLYNFTIRCHGNYHFLLGSSSQLDMYHLFQSR